MLAEKIYEVTVDVPNPINFCADPGRHLMAALRDKYVGRCFKGAFIARVIEIRRNSRCSLVTTNASGEGRVDVEFLAEVAVFSRWDILVGVKVVAVQPTPIGVYEAAEPGDSAGAGAGAGRVPPTAVVTIRLPDSGALAVDQRVAVRVVLAAHPSMQPQVMAVGALLVCDQAAPVYRLRAGGLDASARAELAPLLQRAEEELGRRALLVEARPGDVWFFEALLCSYRLPAEGGGLQRVEAWDGGPAWEGPPAPSAADSAGVEAVSVLDVARRVLRGEAVSFAGVWSRPLALYRSSPLACRVPPGAQVPASWAPPAEGAPRAVLAEFLKNIIDFLVAVREMVGVYGDREAVERHRSLWAVMRAAQRPVEAQRP